MRADDALPTTRGAARSSARRAARAAAAAAGTVGVVAGVAGAYAARTVSGPARDVFGYGFTPFEMGLDAQDVTFEASDGVRLAGWWLDRPGSERVVIVCHGHRGSKADMLGIGPGLWRAGESVLMFDFRGNGDSGDGYQSLAHYEQRDLDAAIDFVRALRPDARVAVVGFSMGAAVTALVAARRPDVEAVVLDSPFADMRGVVAHGMRRMRVPTVPVLAASDLATLALYRYRYADVRPVDVIGRIAPRPLLLVHGEKDRVIPVDNAHALYAAAGEPKRLELYPDADHCGAYFLDRPAYIALVHDWLCEALPGRG